MFAHIADFQSAELRGPTCFQEAHFKTRVPAFFNATFHEYTDWHDAKWPSVSGDANKAREQIQHYQRLALVMNKLEKPDDRHLFFRLEMRARLRTEGGALPAWETGSTNVSVTTGMDLPASPPSGLDTSSSGAILICAARAIGPTRKGTLMADSVRVHV